MRTRYTNTPADENWAIWSRDARSIIFNSTRSGSLDLFRAPVSNGATAALLLLWKGICAWIARHPECRVLFGAVSISSRYHDRTREMLMAFLAQNQLDARRAALVAALDPYPEPRAALCGGPVPASTDEAPRTCRLRTQKSMLIPGEYWRSVRLV